MFLLLLVLLFSRLATATTTTTTNLPLPGQASQNLATSVACAAAQCVKPDVFDCFPLLIPSVISQFCIPIWHRSLAPQFCFAWVGIVWRKDFLLLKFYLFTVCTSTFTFLPDKIKKNNNNNTFINNCSLVIVSAFSFRLFSSSSPSVYEFLFWGEGSLCSQGSTKHKWRDIFLKS